MLCSTQFCNTGKGKESQKTEKRTLADSVQWLQHRLGTIIGRLGSVNIDGCSNSSIEVADAGDVERSRRALREGSTFLKTDKQPIKLLRETMVIDCQSIDNRLRLRVEPPAEQAKRAGGASEQFKCKPSIETELSSREQQQQRRRGFSPSREASLQVHLVSFVSSVLLKKWKNLRVHYHHHHRQQQQTLCRQVVLDECSMA